MAIVQSVLGPLDDSQLGVTLSHEHVIASFGDDMHRYPWLFDWELTRETQTRELREAKAGGIDTVIELTTPDLGRDVEFMADVARASGMNVIVATGIWRDIPRSFWERDPSAIADIFVHEIETGIGETEIKAGVIKIANDSEGVSPEGERIIRGAARALIRTGCPISTHHWAPTEVGARQIEILQDEGAPMDRVCIGHSADSTDVGYLETMLQAGVYLSMDRYPGAEGRPTWEQRNATVMALIERGWAHRLMLGHDYAPRPLPKGRRPPDAPGPTRYLFLSTVALPAMREAGVDEETIDLMMREVPRRFLTGQG